jgi:hypothetical protein
MKTLLFSRGLEVLLYCIQEIYESQLLVTVPVPSSIIINDEMNAHQQAGVQQGQSRGVNGQTNGGNGGWDAGGNIIPTNPIPIEGQGGNGNNIQQNNQSNDNNTQNDQTSDNNSSQFSTKPRQTRQRDVTSLYQPHLQYIHYEADNNNQPQSSQTSPPLGDLSQNPIYRQPQLSTALYAQKMAGGGLPISYTMSTQIQGPTMILPSYSTQNLTPNLQNTAQTSKPTQNNPILKMAALPGITLSPNVQQAFLCSINGCELQPEDPVAWINAMRQVLMALFQLMLLAVQRGA